MKYLDLPAQRVPTELLDRFCFRGNLKIGDKLPVNPLAAIGSVTFLRMNDGERQWRVPFVFSPRRQNLNAAIFQLQNCFTNLTFLISCFDAVQSFDSYVAHLVGDRMVSVASHTVHTGSDNEVRAKLLSLAKQFIDVALSIPNVHASIRVFEKCGGLPDVL